MRKKYQVILFQPYIRPFVLNLGRHLRAFTFNHIAPARIGRGSSVGLPSYEKEFQRHKMTPINIVRRLLGIPNVRFRFDQEGDLFFTYGSLVIGRKPYVTYIETGLALYGYDSSIAKNPLAQLIVAFLATRRNCGGLIFLSQAAYKSFYASVNYPAFWRRRLEAKSHIIYPVPIAPPDRPQPRRLGSTLKLLFPGTFYIKGGLEVAHAYAQLRQRHGNKVSLTVITAVHMIRPEDRQYLESLPGLTLRDAKLNEQEMIETYRNHDVFLLPTFREGFGLVLIEALAYGLPVVITDQYATAEMAKDNWNGFIYPNHPLKDYDPVTFKMHGRYSQPKDFYAALFAAQKDGALKKVEDFLVQSVERFLKEPTLLEKFSHNSLTLYRQKFNPKHSSEQLEAVLMAAIKSRPEGA